MAISFHYFSFISSDLAASFVMMSYVEERPRARAARAREKGEGKVMGMVVGAVHDHWRDNSYDFKERRA